MRKILSLTLSFGLVLTFHMSWAQVGATGYSPVKKAVDPTATGSTTTGNNATVGGAAGPVSYTPTVISAPDVSRENAMQNNGLTASKKQGQGGAAAAIAAALMAATMAATCPNCAMKGTCGICAAAGTGLGASMATGSEMDRAQNLSNTQVSDVNPNTKIDKAPAFAGSSEFQAAKKTIEKLEKEGGPKFSKDFKTLTMPDGRTLSVDGLASGGGSGSGLTPLELKAFKDLQKQAQAAIAKKLGVDGDDSAGETYARGAAAPSSTTTPTATGFATGTGRTPANVAGAYKDLNGDRIGVAVDSMFEMMHRRYRASAENDYFIAPPK